MRLYRYRSAPDGAVRLGASLGSGEPVDILAAYKELRPESLDAPTVASLTSTLSLIAAGPERWAEVAEVARDARSSPRLRADPRGESWLCPLDRAASLKDFLAFESHVEKGAARRHSPVPQYWYEAPVYYKGNPRALLGPGGEVTWPRYARRMDFELELAMIIGIEGRDVPAADAARHIFGFTIFNDFSARDVQSKEMSAWLGPARAKDFANALGPCIVTADEVGPEPDLLMSCRVNGQEWGRARSSEARWRWADMVAHVSECEDVYPGDVYGSGTPGGCCGLDLGRELQPGDVVDLEIERIGVLTNRIGPRG